MCILDIVSLLMQLIRKVSSRFDHSLSPIRIYDILTIIGSTELKSYYKHNRSRALPDIILRQQQEQTKKRKINGGKISDDASRQAKTSRETGTGSFKSRLDGNPTSSLMGKQHKTTSKPKNQASNSSRKDHKKTKKVLITSTMKESTRSLLEPSIAAHQATGKTQQTMANILHPFILDLHGGSKKLHEMLRHLPSDYRVEIFDRKNGRILKGVDSVSIHDLPFVLRRHAEYEPLIPPPLFIES